MEKDNSLIEIIGVIEICWGIIDEKGQLHATKERGT